jgi:hypothetical protein
LPDCNRYNHVTKFLNSLFFTFSVKEIALFHLPFLIKLKISFALEKSFSSRISDLLAILEFEGIKLNGFFTGSKNVFSDFTISTTLFCVLVSTFLISLFSLISLDLTG